MMKPNRANSLFSTDLSDLLAAQISGGNSISLEATSSSSAGESTRAFVSAMNTTGADLPLNTTISLGKGFAEAIGSDPVTTVEALGQNPKVLEFFRNYHFKCREHGFAKEFFSFIHFG